MNVALKRDYRPSAKEEFMNPTMSEYFRRKLLSWRNELLSETNESAQHLREDSIQEPDVVDSASIDSEHFLDIRKSDRVRKLIAKIDEALERIDSGEYGYCEISNEPISLSRLEARPIATLSIEAQERHERMEKTRLFHSSL